MANPNLPGPDPQYADFVITDDPRNPGRKMIKKQSAGRIMVAAGADDSEEAFDEARKTINRKIRKLDAAGAYALESGHIVRSKEVSNIVFGWETEELARTAAESDRQRDEARAKRKAAEEAAAAPPTASK